MNGLVGEMVRSLSELQLGFKGELTMSDLMEQLADALFMGQISPSWQKRAFPSTRPLDSWLANLKQRCQQLEDWTNDPISIPKVVDISRLFNPQSFLTAIKQVSCQANQYELNKLAVVTDVTKKMEAKGIDAAARDGAYVCGMFLEGARWDIATNSLEDSKPKEMFAAMPIVNCRAVPMDQVETKNMYICPCYCTPGRRPNFVFAAQLRTKYLAAKWILAGVALVLDIGVSV